MTTRQQIVAEARSWIGTPFGWHRRAKGHRVDCGGLLIMVGRATGCKDLDDYPRYRPESLSRVIETLLRERFDRVSGPPLPGDILHMAGERGLNLHTGIVTEVDHRGMMVVHAYMGVGVVEQRLPYPVINAYRYRGLEE